MKLRIATWNLDRPGARRKFRVADQVKVLDAIEADILILTETHEVVRPTALTYSFASECEPGYHVPGEGCAAIWSRFPLVKIDSQEENRYLTVCAEIRDHPDVGNVIVYGTIITYGGDGVRERQAEPWARHRAAIKSQAAEWANLRQCYPNHLMVIAGDFNENLNSKRWYGLKIAKDEIRAALDANDLQCLTAAEEIQSMAGDGVLSRCTVDHLCTSTANVQLLDVRRWEGKVRDVSLSDHNGVVADIEFAPSH